ncbi:MAG: YggU family protein [Gammaproteobacteria bacterium]|nr:YggU family protein [Gammaproteobacteria bacterium]MBU1414561.1 YggU family protein [Gammaproteobacteria bacterium]
MKPCWLRAAGDDVVLTLHVQPGAKRTEIAGVHGEALKVRLGAPPVDGKANDCLIAYLAERFGMPKSRVVLESGLTSRSKRVRIVGIDVELVATKLG